MLLNVHGKLHHPEDLSLFCPYVSLMGILAHAQTASELQCPQNSTSFLDLLFQCSCDMDGGDVAQHSSQARPSRGPIIVLSLCFIDGYPDTISNRQ